jgi:short-subunit dehydrogenase
MQIEGKVALITGASEGIGAACTEALAKRGARLSLVARNEAKLKTVAASGAIITVGDLTQPEIQEQVVAKTLSQFGRIDILINVAGIGLYAPSWNTPPNDARRMFDLNFFAPLALIQLVAPHMRQRHSGTIVNVSSVAGGATLPWLTLYSASKAALASMTDGLRIELRKDGIRALTVCPGYVQTDFQSHVLGGAPPSKIARTRKFAITPEQCAESIARGIERDARTIMAPWSGWLFVWARRMFPAVVDAQLAAILHDV